MQRSSATSISCLLRSFKACALVAVVCGGHAAAAGHETGFLQSKQASPATDKLQIGSTLVNTKDGEEMVWVPAGEFTMGSDDVLDSAKPVRQVFMDGYWIYLNDVTVVQYKDFCAATGRELPKAPPWGLLDDNPVVNVSWSDAQAYSKWAGVELPTEAQWEKAARGTDARQFPWGHDFDFSKLQASRVDMGDVKTTAPVGSFPTGASPYGCLDMAGNVWQWCADWYADYDPETKHNPTGPPAGTARMVRGGSWDFVSSAFFRTSCRLQMPPETVDNSLGFRCVQRPVQGR